jgi:CheY-like chemotaxis protein
MYQSLAVDVLEPEASLVMQRSNTQSVAMRKLNVMLVEDVQSDAMLTRIALDATKVPYSLSKVSCGNDVLPRLTVSKAVCPSELPDIIMLDLGLPIMDGFEVLAEMATLPASLRHIPIAILTGHKHFEYLRNTYPYLHIIGYLNKPCPAEDMQRLLLQAQREREQHSIH